MIFVVKITNFVVKVMNFAFKMNIMHTHRWSSPGGRSEGIRKKMNFMIENDGFYITNDGFCIKNDEFWMNNDGIFI